MEAIEFLLFRGGGFYKLLLCIVYSLASAHRLECTRNLEGSHAMLLARSELLV